MNTKRYMKEFRLQAARLVIEQGYTYAEISKRLGSSASCFCKLYPPIPIARRL
jgi:transposase-like protein